MQDPLINEQTLRDRLMVRRKRLLENFFKNPANTPLAIEIRSIDDQVAVLTELLAARRIQSRGKDLGCILQGIAYPPNRGPETED